MTPAPEPPGTARREQPGRLRALLRRPSAALGVFLVISVSLVGLLAPEIAPGRPNAVDYKALMPPSLTHLMGTDDSGRDLARAVVHGIRTSMTVVLWTTLISIGIALVAGSVAGYVGGLIDDLISRTAELVQSVPRFFLALLVVSLWGPQLRNLIVLLGLTSWPFLTRVIRAEALSLREREFVDAARASGASTSRVVLRHVLPGAAVPAAAIASLMASRVIMIEATLAYLGLGDPYGISLGQLAVRAQPYLQRAWWMFTFPGLAIFAIVLGLTLVGDAMTGMLHPDDESRRWDA